MFTITCPVREGSVLIWPSRIDHVHSATSGIEVTFRCVCGQEGVLRTGRLAQRYELLRHSPGAVPAGV